MKGTVIDFIDMTNVAKIKSQKSSSKHNKHDENAPPPSSYKSRRIQKSLRHDNFLVNYFVFSGYDLH